MKKVLSYKVLLPLLVICYTYCTAIAQTSTLRFRHLTVDNGLSHTDATAILQDNKGFIWIGTFSGLNRYDGYTTKVFYNKTDDTKAAYLNRISDMKLSKENDLWMATEGGLALFSPSALSFKIIRTANAKTTASIKMPLQKLIIAGNKIYTVAQKNIHIYSISEDFLLTEDVGSPFVMTNGVVLNFESDSSGNVLAAYSGGILCFSSKGKVNKLFFEDAAANNISALHMDRKNSLTISNTKGLFLMDGDFLEKTLSTSNESVWLSTTSLYKIASFPSKFSLPNNIQYDLRGNLWISSANGAYKYSLSEKKVDAYVNNEFDKSSITANTTSTVFIDKSDCIWFTTFGGGVNIADLNQKPFHLLQRTPNSSKPLSANYTRALLEDEKGNLWIGTRNNGLNYYDFSANQYTQFHPGNSGLHSENIRSLLRDSKNRLWIGSDVGISIRNPNGSFENLKPGGGTGDLFLEGNYFALAEDKFNQIWAGSWNSGLSRIVYKGNGNYHVERVTAGNKKHSILSNRVTFIYTDKNKSEILVGTDHGLNHIFLNPDGAIAQIRDYNNGENNTALSSSFVWPVMRQGDSLIWVGTLGGGLNKIRLYDNGRYEIFNIKDNANQELKDIESMLMDSKGNLWLAGKMLAMYSPSENRFVYYDVNDGLQGNSFKIGAAYASASGRLYFGGINGINYFDPTAILSSNSKPSVAFTGLLVNGESAERNEEVRLFAEGISYMKQLKLTSSQNNFSVQFSSMHYANPERCKYRYRLEGYDKNWIYTDASNRYATYSNLAYGNYTLKVETANSDGIWAGNEEKLSISILAPWWKTTLAKIIYFLLLLGVIYIVWRYQHSWFALKRKVQFKELEEKKQEELHQMKLQFFTNISHEFRTPLTLILGPTEKMLHSEVKKEEQHNYLRLIYSNARRLLGLTNELMDFRKVETDTMKLHVAQNDLQQFVGSIGAEFRELAAEKEIVYIIKPSSTNHLAYFDPNIIEKILVNLISNSFKYTDNNGLIEVEILHSLENFKPKFNNHVIIPSAINDRNMVWIRVADTGIGITDKSIQNIFDRYFRVNTTGREKHLGSGVGLALVKSLVELHKGTLHVYSERNEGTEFLVGIPAEKENYKSIEILSDTDFSIDFESLHYTIDWINQDDTSKPDTTTKNINTGSSALRKRLLVVEDNTEMRKFLVNSLSDSYDVIEAGDGIQGLKMANEYFPDLIISDLMMPDMDGNELCKAIRQDVNTSHISFILITAKSSMDTHLEGLECGADIYFPKPFSLRLLQVTISNLFEKLDRIKSKYNQDVFADARELVNNDRDKEFLDELIGIIEQNMEDEELDVEMICKKIGMSRTKLYGKVKAVTGQAIGEFTRVLRLKRAAKMLVSEDVSILEVMFRVGIQSQSYFTKAFKKEFGKTPSQFVSEFSKRGKSAPFGEENPSDEQLG
jgi:signal transduction histidine kinase/ligand-binding sensor domain-containing protein/DNA-binding response OmpR family regulator